MGNEIIDQSLLHQGLLVQSQAELDKALADGVADLRIEHPHGIYLTIAEDPGFWLTLRGNSRATLRGNSRATLWENASAELRGNSRATLWENASATLWENASATLRGNSRAELSRFTVAWLRSPSAKATGTGHVIDVTNATLSAPDTWAAFHGVKVVDGIATVY